MFERFTDRARRVVVLAQEEARLLDHDHIGTEHLLLALVHERSGVAAKALAALGVDLEAARAQVVQLSPRGTSAPAGQIPFTPRAKKVLELALRESLQLGHNYIGTEHILLGVVREGTGVGCQALVGLGVSPADVEAEVVALTAGRGGGAVNEAVGWTLRSVQVPGGPIRPVEGARESEEVPVLRRFTPDAWRVLLLAASEAVRLGRTAVGEEHVLLGILAEGEGRGARALAAAGVTLAAARAKAEQVLGRGEGAGARSAELLPAALDIIELALVEAVGAGRHDIDTEHLLLGLVHQAEDGTGNAAQALDMVGTSPDAVRAAVAGLDAT